MKKKPLRLVFDRLFFDRQDRFFTRLAIQHLHRKGDDLGEGDCLEVVPSQASRAYIDALRLNCTAESIMYYHASSVFDKARLGFAWTVAVVKGRDTTTMN
jgi:hypothetical protein